MLIKRISTRALRLVTSAIPLSLVRLVAEKGLLVPVYHVVSDEDLPHIKHLYSYKSLKEFRSDLDFFLKNYSPISLFDLLKNRKSNRHLPKNPLLLTFDDGCRELFDNVIPILKERGVPATFFLVTNCLDNKELFYKHKASILIDTFQKSGDLSSLEKIKAVFSRNQIEFTNFKVSTLSIKYHQKSVLDELAWILNIDFSEYLLKTKPYLNSEHVERMLKDGFTIGAHGLDHPSYSFLSLEDQLDQTKESVKLIRENFSLDYSAFAFPFNDKGVSRKYFDEILGHGYVDVSFGTSSMMTDAYSNSIQRSVMETIAIPAKNMITIRYAIKILRLMTGKNKIRRN